MERVTKRTETGKVRLRDYTVSMKDVIDKCAEYEELEEQGLLLRLPCKVGDKIYRIGTMCDFGENPSEICDTTDCEKCFYGKALIIKEGIAKEYHIRRFLEGNSKHDFLTRTEAEKAMAEM